jgi:hypothetical protein
VAVKKYVAAARKYLTAAKKFICMAAVKKYVAAAKKLSGGRQKICGGRQRISSGRQKNYLAPSGGRQIKYFSYVAPTGFCKYILKSKYKFMFLSAIGI